MKAATPDAVLSGNGVVASSTKPSAAFRGTLEPLQARAYTNAALAGRTIVRLVQERVTSAEDATLAVLGFRASSSPVVGQAKRRAVGFPAAAIVKAPTLAKYALEIMKDFQREARRIKSKPGHALQGFGKLADELGRSVPAFLPSFWEEAARAFLGSGSAEHAGQCFGKARAAEDVHHLDVDEAERHEAFLEFALAGGLSIGTLSDYAKTLEKRYATDDAYQRFRALCRERVLGGLPPWGTMLKELARLAKAAKLDVAAEEAELLHELLASPAIVTAPQAFWESAQRTLVSMTQADPSIGARLLDLRPKPSPAKDTFAGVWLALLHATGAIDALIAGTPAEAQPRDGAAAAFGAWVGLADGHYTGYPNANLVKLLDQLAPRLIQDGAPVRVWFGWRQHWDLDLLERALALGVPVLERTTKLHPIITTFDLRAWAQHASEPGRGLDPTHIAAHPSFGPALAAAIGSDLQHAEFQAASAGKAGFLVGKRAYFRGLVDAANRGGVMALQQLVESLRLTTRAGTFDDLPELHAELVALDFAPMLARTLRGGLPDELVWPAWEAAVSGLGDSARVLGPFPHPIVGDGQKVAVLDRDGVVFTHDARLPKGAEVVAARWVGGELMVRFTEARQEQAYWSSAPTTHVALESSWRSAHAEGLGVVLADGAWTEGGKAIVRGDTTWPEARHILHDGHTLWQLKYEAAELTLRELDPRTGALGRASLPAFLAGHAGGNGKLELNAAQLYPIDAPDSPLGTKDGLAGWCVRVVGGSIEGIGIDGRTTLGRLQRGHLPAGLLTFPGHAEPLRIARTAQYYGSFIQLDDASGATLATITPPPELRQRDLEPFPWASRALRLMPFATWHYLRPRDLAASHALRATSDETARQLMAKVAAVDTKLATEDAVRALTPIREPVLVTMIATRARHTVALAAEARDLLARAAPTQGQADIAPELKINTLREVLGAFASFGYGDESLAGVLRVLGKAIADPARHMPTQDMNPGLFTFLGREAVLVALAASPGYDAHRDTLLALYAALRALALPAAARVRHRMVMTDGLDALVPTRTLVARGRSLWYAQGYHDLMPQVQVYEVALDGAFATKPPTLSGEAVYRRVPDWGDEAAALVRERGAIAWQPAIAEALAAATGLSYAEAVLLWAGLPYLGAYEKNFLPKALREAFELKVDQAYIARERLKQHLAGMEARLDILLDALPTSPDALYTPLSPDGHVARLAAAWNKRFGQRQQVDEALLAAAKKDLDALDLEPADAFALFTQPSGSALLRGKGFDEKALRSLVAYTTWLFHELPVGHPARAGIPAVLAAVREQLMNPQLEIAWGYTYQAGVDEALAYVTALGGNPLASKDPKVAACDLGAVRVSSSYSMVSFTLVPARFDEPHAAELIASFAGKVSYRSGDPLVMLTAARSPELSALATRATSTPVPSGGYETNPRVSVPALVDEVAATLSLSHAAAAYYLQLLVLPNPSDARVLLYNDASGRALEVVAAELIDKELVVTGTRARAGREVFLPGGWVELKAPYPPMELWKLAFHGLTKVEGESFATIWGQVLMLEPAHVLFARAWAEVRAGCGPRFEEAGEARRNAKKKGKT